MALITISDQFIRRVLEPLLALIFVAVAVPPTLILFILWETEMFSAAESSRAIAVIDAFNWAKDSPTSIAHALAQIFPAIVASLCLGKNRDYLSVVGRFVFLLTVYIIAVSFFARSVVDPTNPKFAENISGGRATLEKFVAVGGYCLNFGLVYFGLLTGFSMAMDGKRDDPAAAHSHGGAVQP
jgi:hypothetical protein